MGAFKVVKLVDPIYIATSGVALAHTGATATSGTFLLAEGNNITFSTNGNTVSIHGGAGGGGGGVGIAAGTQTAGTGTIVFSNSNGVTFGMSGSTRITASHNGLTTAMLSNEPHIRGIIASDGTFTSGSVVFTGSNGISVRTGAGQNIIIEADGHHIDALLPSGNGYGTGFSSMTSGTIGLNFTGAISASQNGNGISVSVPVQTVQTQGMVSVNGSTGNISFVTGSSLSSSSNGSTITFGLASNITTALQSAGAYLTTAALSSHSHNLATTTTGGASIVVGTANSAGATIGVPAYLTTAQPVGAYLTTARASTDAIGLNTAQTNVTWTVNSSGLSINASGYAGTGTSATNASITLNSAGLAISVAAPGAGGGVGIEAGTRTATTAGTLRFETGNGITFGLNAVGGSVMTASHNGLTTARASNDAIGLNTALTAGPLAWTVNSSGISLNAGSAAGTTSNFAGNLISGSMTHNTAGLNLSLNHPAWLTTAMLSNAATLSAINVSAGTTSSNQSSIGFSNANGLSFGFSGASITGSHNALTTAMASNRGTDFVQATAAFAGTNASGTIASNGISVSVAAPGAAAENNWMNLLGANTAGNTTASGSTIGYSGINLTLSGTNGSVVNISAPATSSLSATGGFQISSNGSTISMGPGMVSSFANILYKPENQTQQALASTFIVHPFVVSQNVSFDFLRLVNSVSIASTSIASTANTTFSYNQAVTFRVVLYSQLTGASSMSLASISSTTAGLTVSLNAYFGSATNTSQANSLGITYPIATGTSSFSSSYATSNLSTFALSTGNYTRLTGYKFLDIPFAGSLPPGDYWFAFNASTTQTTQGTAGLSAMRLLFSTIGLSQGNNTYANFGAVNNASVQAHLGVGSFTTVGGATTASFGFSNVSSSASHVVPYFSLSRTTN